MMKSIRTKITAITIAAILTSVLSVVFASFFTMEAEYSRISAEMMNLMSRDTQKSLDEYLMSIEQSVEMASNIAVDSLDSTVLIELGVIGNDTKQRNPEQEEKLDEYLDTYCDKIFESFGSFANHTHGVVSYFYCITPEVSQNEHGFFYSKVGKAGFEQREPLDAGKLDPDDAEHTAWYFTPIRHGRPTWVGPYPATALNEVWTLSYLVPIYKSGTLIGILGMDILLDTLVEQIEPIRVYKTGFASLVDENGKILYHPTMNIGDVPNYADLSVSEEMLKENNSGDKLIRYSIDHQERQMAFSTLSNGMKLVVTAPVSEINEPWNRLSRIILLTTLAIIGAFALIMLFVMRILTNPLQQLTSASGKLANGDYDVDLPYQGQDEVGKLTDAFVKMRDSIKAYINDLNRRIYTDDLTDLANMSGFMKNADKFRQKYTENGVVPVFLFIDLIGMKYYNRQFGFTEGDVLLRDVSEILCRYFDKEQCARLGQDHFAIICDNDHPEEILEKVFADCRQANNGNALPVRVGIYKDQYGDVHAGVACDRAKFACDRNRGSYESDYYYFDSSLMEAIETDRYIVSNFDRALKENWIKVFYQPIVRAANGKVCDEEALSRWHDPQRGNISPAVFVPILENSRQVYKLDLYVLDQILQKMKNQQEEGLYVVPQSLNLSRVDFEMCDIVELVCEKVDAAGIGHDKLTIEITESAVGMDMEFIREQVIKMQNLGFKVWMDDFGSGYSSLDVLQDIHFDLLKFDMRFMHKFGDGKETGIILTELMKMAIDLGLETIAEGVETKEQADFLTEIGCTKLQGYYFSKPVPMEEIIERRNNGKLIGFENPDETDYYTAVGKISLYDPSAATGYSEELRTYFDALPMAVAEVSEDGFRYMRTNRTYRDFLGMNTPDADVSKFSRFDELAGAFGLPFSNSLQLCRKEGAREFFDEKLPDGRVIHSLVRNIANNPVNGIAACIIIILEISNAQTE